MGAQNRDKMEAIVEKYWPMVLMRCRRLLGDAMSAEDAAQDVFLKAIENQYVLSSKYPSSLLWTMATNRCLDILSSAASRSDAPGGDSLLSRIACSTDIEAEYGARSILKKLFGRHPVSSRTIAVLYFVDGLTLEEVAKKVGLSAAGVYKRLQVLRKDLKELEDM